MGGGGRYGFSFLPVLPLHEHSINRPIPISLDTRAESPLSGVIAERDGETGVSEDGPPPRPPHSHLKPTSVSITRTK